MPPNIFQSSHAKRAANDRLDHGNQSCQKIHGSSRHSDWSKSKHSGQTCQTVHGWWNHSEWQHENTFDELNDTGISCVNVHPDVTHHQFQHKGIWCHEFHGNEEHRAWYLAMGSRSAGEAEAQHPRLTCSTAHPAVGHNSWVESGSKDTVQSAQSIPPTDQDVQKLAAVVSNVFQGSHTKRAAKDRLDHGNRSCQEVHGSSRHSEWLLSKHSGQTCKTAHDGVQHGTWQSMDEAALKESNSAVTGLLDQSTSNDHLDHDDRACSSVHDQQRHPDWLIADHPPNNCAEEHDWCDHKIWRHDVDYYSSELAKKLCQRIHPEISHSHFEHLGKSCVNFHFIQSHKKWFRGNSFLSAGMALQEHPGKPCAEEHVGDHREWLSSKKRKADSNVTRGARIENLRTSRTPVGFDPSKKSDPAVTILAWVFGIFILIVIFSALGDCSDGGACTNPNGCQETPRDARAG
jgi:hypothetical protein